MTEPIATPKGLSRSILLDMKRNGQSDMSVAAQLGSTAEKVATLRAHLGVPALVCDLTGKQAISGDANKTRPRSVKDRPIGTGKIERDRRVVYEPSIRTTDHAERHMKAFFSKHPDFSADEAPARLVRRIPIAAAR